MNIKTKQSGFTIVELLIVVVVIAILAAITLVSFNNITNRANDSAAKETASNVQKKIELYNVEESTFPTTRASITAANKSYTLPTGMMLDAAPTASNGKGAVQVRECGGDGVVITYWEYNKTGGAGLTDITIGTVPASPYTSCTALD